MKSFTRVTSTVTPLDRSNVDTDAIIPKQYLKSVSRIGFGAALFDEWRYLDCGGPGGENHRGRRTNSKFVLNQPRYKGSEILLARENFGCGSSREHAVWALMDHGFRSIIAPSFADIFFNNCFKNGLFPVALDKALVDRLFRSVEANEGYSLTVDLQTKSIILPSNERLQVKVDEDRRFRLLNGLDDISLTLLQHAGDIRAFEANHRKDAPWLFQAETP